MQPHQFHCGNYQRNVQLYSLRHGEHGADYADALAQAQKLGFAEEDPSLDVNGWDAAHKALILAMLAYGTTISPDKIYVRGIENITSRDFEFAKKLGYTIKLLVVIRYHEGAGRRSGTACPALFCP